MHMSFNQYECYIYKYFNAQLKITVFYILNIIY